MNHSGACAWLAYATRRAIGFRPRALAAASLAMTMAAAPSEIEDDEAAVTVPSLPKAGFSVGILSMSSVNGVSSCGDDLLALARLHRDRARSRRRSRLPSTARSARRTDSAANASCASRVKPYFTAVTSAKQPIALPSHGLCRPS